MINKKNSLIRLIEKHLHKNGRKKITKYHILKNKMDFVLKHNASLTNCASAYV